jgi:ribosomal protein S18 acetylase RimI-like enzyme
MAEANPDSTVASGRSKRADPADRHPIIRPLVMADYAAVRRLWENCEGIGLNDADRPQALRRYLVRNPGLSFVALQADALVGAVLCGHDGRRGYLNHLAVHPQFRCRGLARRMVACCLEALEKEGIAKCHLFIFSTNEAGRRFWARIGWELRDDLAVASRILQPPEPG